jgi:hypothetical protein
MSRYASDTGRIANAYGPALRGSLYYGRPAKKFPYETGKHLGVL